MSPFMSLTVAAAAAILIGAAMPAAAGDVELAQGKSSGKAMSAEKASDKARDAMDKKDDRMTGRDNAMERGEGEKKGLMKHADGMKKGGKPEK